jgi:hypothetical protein
MIKMLVVECLVECLVEWAAWAAWVEWACNLIFSSENFKNPNGSNTFGVFFVLTCDELCDEQVMKQS